jgi:DNA-binding NtrC family response regulator
MKSRDSIERCRRLLKGSKVRCKSLAPSANTSTIYSNLCRVLQKEGYEVDCAASGSEAMEKLTRDSFDLVVTDLKMNGIDGLDLVKKGKTVSQGLPFILITGYGTAQTAASAAREGADVFLMKPIDMTELKSAVKKALRK